MCRARALGPGSVISVVAPASPFDVRRFDRGLDCMRTLGLQIKLGAHLRDRQQYLAGDDGARAADLIAAIEDPDSDAIWCARGGFGSTRILNLLSALQPARAKLLIGFSDISALHALWFSRFGLCSVHGPVLTSLGDEPDDSVAHLWAVLSGQAKGRRLPLRPFSGPGEANGTLFASNLSLLVALIGTPYLPDLGKCVLVIEEVGERPYRLDRLLTQVRQSGLLAGVEALVFGQLTNCDESDGSILASDALRRALDGVDLPIFDGLSVGHQSPNYALPIGARVHIDDEALKIDEEIVDTASSIR